MIDLVIIDKPRRLQNRCQFKISHDGGQTWWPRGPLEIHVAGECYCLLMNGRYERKST